MTDGTDFNDQRPEPVTDITFNEAPDIEPGVYYWSVTAPDCDWSLRTLPQQE